MSKRKKINKTKRQTQNQKQRMHEKPPHKNHKRPNADSQGPWGNSGMRNKYVTSPCMPDHPRYIGIGVQIKYFAKEGAKVTTPHTKTNNQTIARVVNHAYIHMPRPYIHMSIDAKRPQNTWGRRQGQGETWYGKQHNKKGMGSRINNKVSKKRGEERYERLPPPATPTHPLHLAHALYRGYTRYDKEVCYRTDTLDTYI